MVARTIKVIGDGILREKAAGVEEITDDVISLISDLIDTMRANGGAGLSAPQVGIGSRVVVIDCSSLEGGNPFPVDDQDILILINPELVYSVSTVTWREACLSLPGVSGMVERSEQVIVTFLDTEGGQQKIDVGWPLAGAIQHECDHLDGVLYPDKMKPLARKFILRKFKKLKSKVESVLRERMKIPREDNKQNKKIGFKALKSRRSRSKVSRVSRRSNRSR